MIDLNSISRVFKRGETTQKALDNVSIHIDAGEFVGIVGPSASGKTTLLNIIAFLDYPTDGTYIFDNINISGQNERRLSKLRADRIGYITQNHGLINEMTVIENVILPLTMSKRHRIHKMEIATEILSKLSMSNMKRTYPRHLSGGQCQMVAIARALVNKPDLILADEPTGALDSKSSNEIMRIFSGLNEKGQTIVMVTRDERMLPYFSRIIKMQEGKVIPYKKL